jgi:glycosyltransferase involved in cell wall biosynthesis
LPLFFSKEEIKSRTQEHYFIAKTKDHVIFSSKDAYRTFERLFPASRVYKYILRFAVTHSLSYKDLDGEMLKKKYGIVKPYFFAPNQFWKHKNQAVVLKALVELKSEGVTGCMIAFSGKEHDYRNPDYFDSLKKFVSDNGLKEYIIFLGFIDRDEQLKLMSEALAIIQPSLFEGWSTVVEDAKAMDQFVIASDLPVHREQLEKNVAFFDPSDAGMLAAAIKNILQEGTEKQAMNYQENIKEFGSSFIRILDQVKHNKS